MEKTHQVRFFEIAFAVLLQCLKSVLPFLAWCGRSHGTRTTVAACTMHAGAVTTVATSIVLVAQDPAHGSSSRHGNKLVEESSPVHGESRNLIVGRGGGNEDADGQGERKGKLGHGDGFGLKEQEEDEVA